MTRILLAAILLLSALGCATATAASELAPQPAPEKKCRWSCKQEENVPQEVIAKRDAADVFARSEPDPSRSAYGLRATALLDTPLDPAIVERLVRQKAGRATTLAFQDALIKAGLDSGTAPLRDLLNVMQALAVSTSEGETRSQVLVAALARDGLSFLLASSLGASSAQDSSRPPWGCVDARERLTAAYEGLALSSYLRPLGFQVARGKVSDSCQPFAANVALFVDTLSAVGNEAQDLRELRTDAQRAITSCKAVELPVELQGALQRLSRLRVRELQSLSAAYARAKLSLQNGKALSGSAIVDCVGALQDTTDRVDRILSRVGTGSTADLDLDALEKNVLLVTQRFGLQTLQRAFGDAQVPQEVTDKLEALRGAAPVIRYLSTLAIESCPAKSDITLGELSTLLTSLAGPDATARKAYADQCLAGLWQRTSDAVNVALGETDTAKKAKLQQDAIALLQFACPEFRGDFAAVSQWASAGGPDLGACRAPLPLLRTLWAQRGATLTSLDSKLAKAHVAELAAALSSSKDVQALLPALQNARDVLIALASGKPMRRGDLIALTRSVHKEVERLMDEGKLGKLTRDSVPGDVLVAFFNAVPDALREDPSTPTGVRVDVPTLATTTVARFSESSRDGVYLRATVGVGYVLFKGTPLSSVHEELGIGVRRHFPGSDNITIGLHVAASGLLYEVVSPGVQRGSFLVSVGPDVNFYRLVELSGGIAMLHSPGADNPHWDPVGIMSLQIPLADYFTELAAGSGEATQVSPTDSKE